METSKGVKSIAAFEFRYGAYWSCGLNKTQISSHFYKNRVWYWEEMQEPYVEYRLKKDKLEASSKEAPALLIIFSRAE